MQAKSHKSHNNKSSSVLLKTSKSFCDNKSILKTKKSHSIIDKNLSIQSKYQPILLKDKYSNKTKSFLKIQKNDQTTSFHKNFSNIKPHTSLKQNLTPNPKSSNPKSKIYILNPSLNHKPLKFVTINHKNQSKSSNNNNFTKFADKKKFDLKKNAVNITSFAKSIDYDKLKKKKNQYIQKCHRTTCLQKSYSMEGLPFNSILYKFEENLRSPQHGERLKYQNKAFISSDCVLDEQSDRKKIQKCPKLNEVRLNVNNLFKTLESSNKKKLLLISRGYEKIVTQLYHQIPKDHELPVCQLSRIDTQESNDYNQNKLFGSTETKFLSTVDSHNNYQKDIQRLWPSKSTSALLDKESEHLGSYQDFASPIISIKENQLKTKIFKEHELKKLDLQQLKKLKIKEYQDEFMENQQFFSDSWKRQINAQKRY